MIRLYMVDFPAPLGPAIPYTWPSSTSKLKLLAATSSPNFFVTFSTLSMSTLHAHCAKYHHSPGRLQEDYSNPRSSLSYIRALHARHNLFWLRMELSQFCGYWLKAQITKKKTKSYEVSSPQGGDPVTSRIAGSKSLLISRAGMTKKVAEFHT